MELGLIALLNALPKVVELVNKLGEVSKDKDISVWLDDLTKAVDATSKAKTPEEKTDAAKKLVGILGSL